MNSNLASKVRRDTLLFDDTRISNLLKEDLITLIDHTVMRGETTKSIAEKYSVLEEDIITWNELTPNMSLKPGSKIKIRKNTGEN
jgi:hypothetical protein